MLGVDVGIRLLSALFQQGPKQIPPLVPLPGIPDCIERA